jgi:mono/diheme cytochrome c family protein
MKTKTCSKALIIEGIVTVLVSLSPNWAQASEAVPTDPILEQGKAVFASSGCINCHTADKAKPLAGGFKLSSPFGTFYSPNITPDTETGIGSWTEQQFIKALRKGISPKGEYYYPSFPYTNYTRLSNEDIHALWVYLRSQPAVNLINKKHDLKAPFNNRGLLFFWRLVNFDQVFNHVGCIEYFAKGTGHYNPDPEHSATWNRGAYLVEGPLHCATCHTPRDSFGGYRISRWMGGGAVYGSVDKAPNISPDEETGLGKWTPADWDSFFLTGQNPDGDPVSGEMKLVIRNQTSKLSAEDRAAVIEYLRGLQPVHNKVD